MVKWEVLADLAVGEAGTMFQGSNFHSHYINPQSLESLSGPLF